jgi:hypothetical protein
MKAVHLIWILLASVLLPYVRSQTVVSLGSSVYTLSASIQPRKISVMKDFFVGMAGCRLAMIPIGPSGTKNLIPVDGTYDANCDIYYVNEVVDTTGSIMVVDGKGVLSIFQPANNMLSYIRTTYMKLPYTAYYYPRVYKSERVPNTNYYFIAGLQTNIIFKILVQSGGAASTTRYLTNARSLSYETMAATNNNRLVLMSASGQFMELWDTTSMTFLSLLEFSQFVFGNIYRSVAYYPVVTQQDFILAAKTGLVAHFIDLTNKFIVYEFPIKQENPEFSFYVPTTNYFAVIDPKNIDFLNVLDPTKSKTFAINTGLNMDTIETQFFSRGSSSYMLLTYNPSSTAGIVYDLGSNLCHVSCSTCSASLDGSKCTACQIGYSLEASTGLCKPIVTTASNYFRESDASNVLICGPNEYLTSYKTCRRCSTDCGSCFDFSGFCRACTNTKLVGINGACVSSCDGTMQFNSNGALCRRCHPTCLNCNSIENNACTACHADTVLSSAGVCVPNPSCSSTSNYHWIDKACQTCYIPPANSPAIIQGCSSCTNKNLAYSCLTCNPQYSKLVNSGMECYDKCPVGSVPSARQCIICEQSNGPSDVFYNRTCITSSQCPSEQPYNSSSLTCGQTLTKSNPYLGNSEDDDEFDDDKDRSDSNAGLYILVVAGGLCFIIGTAFCIYGLKKSRNRTAVDLPQLPLQRQGSAQIPLEEVAFRQNSGPSVNVFSGVDTKQGALRIDGGDKPVRQMNTVFGAAGGQQGSIPVVFDQETAILATAQPRKFQITENILGSRRSLATPTMENPEQPEQNEASSTSTKNKDNREHGSGVTGTELLEQAQGQSDRTEGGNEERGLKQPQQDGSKHTPSST